MAGSREVGIRSQCQAWMRTSGRPWAVVLARGEGSDYDGSSAVSRTNLRETLDRVARLIPPERMVVVGLESDVRYVAEEFGERPGANILEQPTNGGTAAAILFAAEWIEARAPRATAVFFPSDHVIPEDARFMNHVVDVAEFVERQPEWIVLFGVQPGEPDTDHDWIEPGERMVWTGQESLYRVRQLREKPLKEVARASFSRTCLWNTSVFAADVGRLLAAGREGVPIRPSCARGLPVAFSQSLLGARSRPLAVSMIPRSTWCGLGNPSEP